MGANRYMVDSGGVTRHIRKRYVIDSGGIARLIRKRYIIDSSGAARLTFQYAFVFSGIAGAISGAGPGFSASFAFGTMNGGGVGQPASLGYSLGGPGPISLSDLYVATAFSSVLEVEGFPSDPGQGWVQQLTLVGTSNTFIRTGLDPGTSYSFTASPAGVAKWIWNSAFTPGGFAAGQPYSGQLIHN